MIEMEYVVWRTNAFNENILSEVVAYFADERLARDFCDYQATFGDSYVVRKREIRKHAGRPPRYSENELSEMYDWYLCSGMTMSEIAGVKGCSRPYVSKVINGIAKERGINLEYERALRSWNDHRSGFSEEPEPGAHQMKAKP